MCIQRPSTYRRKTIEYQTPHTFLRGEIVKILRHRFSLKIRKKKNQTVLSDIPGRDVSVPFYGVPIYLPR